MQSQIVEARIPRVDPIQRFCPSPSLIVNLTYEEGSLFSGNFIPFHHKGNSIFDIGSNQYFEDVGYTLNEKVPCKPMVNYISFC